MVGDYLLFLVLWGATGIIALISGLVAIVTIARQMPNSEPTPLNQPEDTMAA